MISSLANRAATILKERNPDNPNSVEILQFSIHLLLNVIITLVMALSLALVLGHFWSTLLVLVASFILRRYSGGIHMASSSSCITLTVIISNIIPYFHLGGYLIIALHGTGALLAALFAPSRIDLDTNIPRSRYPRLRMISVGIVAAGGLFMSSTIAVTFLLQCISLIQLRRGGERRA